MKVLHIINSLSGAGAQMNVLRLVTQTNRARIEPHVAYCGHWPLEAELQQRDVPLLRLANSPRRVRSMATPRIIAHLATYIRRNKIELVHTHLFNAHVWGALAARLVGAKVLEHVHDHRYADRVALEGFGLPRTHHYDQAGLFARLSNHIVVLTKQNRDYAVHKLGVDSSKISIMLNGLPERVALPTSDERACLRLSLGIPADAFVAVGVGRLAAEKNFKTLIAAVERVRSRVPHLLLLILGQGAEQGALQQQIDVANLNGNVKLLGQRSDVLSFFDCADVFLQPSYFELHSLAMLEAMQAGLPVVVSRGVGANDEMVEAGQTGFLVGPDDVARWAETIATLFEKPELRAAVGSQGKAFLAETCDIRQVSARFEALYESLVG